MNESFQSFTAQFCRQRAAATANQSPIISRAGPDFQACLQFLETFPFCSPLKFPITMTNFVEYCPRIISKRWHFWFFFLKTWNFCDYDRSFSCIFQTEEAHLYHQQIKIEWVDAVWFLGDNQPFRPMCFNSQAAPELKLGWLDSFSFSLSEIWYSFCACKFQQRNIWFQSKICSQ